MNTLLLILDNLGIEEEENENGESEENSKKKQIEEYCKYFMNYEEEFNSCQTSADDIKQISDLDKLLDSGSEESIEIENYLPNLDLLLLEIKLI